MKIEQKKEYKELGMGNLRRIGGYKDGTRKENRI